MSRDRLEDRIGLVVDLGWVTLVNYHLIFDKRGEDGTAKANIAPAPGHTVHGVLYELSAGQFDTLGVIEGGYTRRRVHVKVPGTADDDEPRAVETFVAIPEWRQPGLLPTEAYLAYCVAGAREHALPESYWQTLNELPAVG